MSSHAVETGSSAAKSSALRIAEISARCYLLRIGLADVHNRPENRSQGALDLPYAVRDKMGLGLEPMDTRHDPTRVAKE